MSFIYMLLTCMACNVTSFLGKVYPGYHRLFLFKTIVQEFFVANNTPPPLAPALTLCYTTKTLTLNSSLGWWTSRMLIVCIYGQLIKLNKFKVLDIVQVVV